MQKTVGYHTYLSYQTNKGKLEH